MTDLEKQLDLVASSWKIKALAFEQECFRAWSEIQGLKEEIQGLKEKSDRLPAPRAAKSKPA